MAGVTVHRGSHRGSRRSTLQPTSTRAAFELQQYLEKDTLHAAMHFLTVLRACVRRPAGIRSCDDWLLIRKHLLKSDFSKSPILFNPEFEAKHPMAFDVEGGAGATTGCEIDSGILLNLCRDMRIRDVASGTVLCRRGDRAANCFIVLNGAVKVIEKRGTGGATRSSRQAQHHQHHGGQGEEGGRLEQVLRDLNDNRMLVHTVIRTLPLSTQQQIRRSCSAESCSAAFDAIDTDGNGVLTHDELLPLILNLLGEGQSSGHDGPGAPPVLPVTMEDCKRFAKALDDDGNGEISRDEFAEFMMTMMVLAYLGVEGQASSIEQVLKQPGASKGGGGAEGGASPGSPSGGTRPLPAASGSAMAAATPTPWIAQLNPSTPPTTTRRQLPLSVDVPPSHGSAVDHRNLGPFSPSSPHLRAQPTKPNRNSSSLSILATETTADTIDEEDEDEASSCSDTNTTASVLRDSAWLNTETGMEEVPEDVVDDSECVAVRLLSHYRCKPPSRVGRGARADTGGGKDREDEVLSGTHHTWQSLKTSTTLAGRNESTSLAFGMFVGEVDCAGNYFCDAIAKTECEVIEFEWATLERLILENIAARHRSVVHRPPIPVTVHGMIATEQEERAFCQWLLSQPPEQRRHEHVSIVSEYLKRKSDSLTRKDRSDRIHMVKLLQWMQVRKDQVVFKEGSVGNALYILFEGAVHLETKDPEDELKLSSIIKLDVGESFGENALAASKSSSTRNNTAVVRGEGESGSCVLLVLDKVVYLKALKERREQELMARVHSLRSNPTLQGLSDDMLREVAQYMESKHVGMHEYLYTQGTEGDSLFLIARGHFNVFKQVEQGQPSEPESPTTAPSPCSTMTVSVGSIGPGCVAGRYVLQDISESNRGEQAEGVVDMQEDVVAQCAGLVYTLKRADICLRLQQDTREKLCDSLLRDEMRQKDPNFLFDPARSSEQPSAGRNPALWSEIPLEVSHRHMVVTGDWERSKAKIVRQYSKPALQYRLTSSPSKLPGSGPVLGPGHKSPSGETAKLRKGPGDSAEPTPSLSSTPPPHPSSSHLHMLGLNSTPPPLRIPVSPAVANKAAKTAKFAPRSPTAVLGGGDVESQSWLQEHARFRRWDLPQAHSSMVETELAQSESAPALMSSASAPQTPTPSSPIAPHSTSLPRMSMSPPSKFIRLGPYVTKYDVMEASSSLVKPRGQRRASDKRQLSGPDLTRVPQSVLDGFQTRLGTPTAAQMAETGLARRSSNRSASTGETSSSSVSRPRSTPAGGSRTGSRGREAGTAARGPTYLLVEMLRETSDAGGIIHTSGVHMRVLGVFATVAKAKNTVHSMITLNEAKSQQQRQRLLHASRSLSEIRDIRRKNRTNGLSSSPVARGNTLHSLSSKTPSRAASSEEAEVADWRPFLSFELLDLERSSHMIIMRDGKCLHSLSFDWFGSDATGIQRHEHPPRCRCVGQDTAVVAVNARMLVPDEGNDLGFSAHQSPATMDVTGVLGSPMHLHQQPSVASSFGAECSVSSSVGGGLSNSLVSNGTDNGTFVRDLAAVRGLHSVYQTRSRALEAAISAQVRGKPFEWPGCKLLAVPMYEWIGITPNELGPLCLDTVVAKYANRQTGSHLHADLSMLRTSLQDMRLRDSAEGRGGTSKPTTPAEHAVALRGNSRRGARASGKTRFSREQVIEANRELVAFESEQRRRYLEKRDGETHVPKHIVATISRVLKEPNEPESPVKAFPKHLAQYQEGIEGKRAEVLTVLQHMAYGHKNSAVGVGTDTGPRREVGV